MTIIDRLLIVITITIITIKIIIIIVKKLIFNIVLPLILSVKYLSIFTNVFS